MKIDKRKKYYLVLDTETTNGLQSPLIYNLGIAIYDKKGNEYLSKDFVITNIFDKELELMQTAYYKEKIVKYYEGLLQGNMERIGILQAKKYIREVMEQYNINTIYAYNSNFDVNALNNTIRYVTKSKVRYFLPYNTKVHCIWNMSCQVLCTQKRFLKENVKNNNNNYITNAQRLFSYITNNKDFKEDHMALSDVRIEAKILFHCLKQHKKMNRNINTNCWKIPNVLG